MSPRSVALGALALLVLTGAEGGGCKADREVPVEVVLSSPHCGGQGEGLSVGRLRSVEELRARAPLETTLGGPAEAAAEPPALDLEREAVLVVRMGQRPTAGYAIELARPVALVKGKVAAVQIALRSPAPGAMTAQVVTSPCLVVKLPKEGIDEVKVADGELNVLAEVKLR